MITTDETLLERVRRIDAHEAWRLFYNQYWAVIMAYARKIGLSEHQAEEVLQDTMVALIRILPAFEYDRSRGKFRNFLLTIVHRKSLAVLRKTKRSSSTSIPWEDVAGETLVESLNGNREPDEEAIKRWKESLLEDALRRLRERNDFGDSTFAIFEAYVVRKVPASQVAQTYGIKENGVYQIKNRLMRLLKSDLQRLSEGIALDL